MLKKQFNITPTKIVLDIAPNKFPNDAAFSIRNMKINNQEDGAVLSLVTEKGNTMSLKINGIVLHILDCIELGVLLFVKDLECTTNSKNPEKKDTLMLINKNEVGELSSKIIYLSDDLNFSEEAVIDSIYSYETENINKVYWVDGVHSTRVINLNRNYKVPNPEGEEEGNEEKFLNIRYLEFDISNLPESAIPNVTISAINNTYTMFTLGTILYAISYFNKNLIESPIVYTSPIYYISNEGMALSKDGSQFSTTSFNLEIEVDALFDYIGLYRIHNIDSVYTVTRIREIEISSLPLMSDTNRRKATITDLGGTGVPISIDLFLLLGGLNIIGSTLEQKDSTLFIGNINIKKELVPLEIKDFLKNYANIYYANVATTNTSNDNINSITYYAKNLTKSNDLITYFKYCETYRFGLLLLDRGGKWSEVIFIGDKKNESVTIELGDNEYLKNRPNAVINLKFKKDDELLLLLKKNYIGVRPVCVYPTGIDREFICLGIMTPVLSTAQIPKIIIPDWFARSIGSEYFPLLDDGILSGINIYKYPYGENSVLGEIATYGPLIYKLPIETSNWKLKMASPPTLFGNKCCGSELCDFLDESDLKTLRDSFELFYMNGNICTFHSPELDSLYGSTILHNTNFSKYAMRIVGYTSLSSVLSYIKMVSTEPYLYPEGGMITLNDSNYHIETGESTYGGGAAKILWRDRILGFGNAGDGTGLYKGEFPVYLWLREGPLNNGSKSIPGYTGKYSLLISKKTSILRILRNNYYTYNTYSNPYYYDLDIKDIVYVSGKSDTPITLKLAESPYSKNYTNTVNLSFIPPYVSDESMPTQYGYSIASVNGKAKYPKSTNFKSYYSINNMQTITDDFNSVWMGGIAARYNIEHPINIQYKMHDHCIVSLGEYKGERLDKDYYTEPVGKWLPANITIPISWNEIYSNDILYSYMEKYPFENVNYNTTVGYLLVEIVNPFVDNSAKFGGSTLSALEKNIWNICGPIVPISNIKEEEEEDQVVLRVIADQGDTYCSRYECLRTYPLSDNSTNLLSEVVSFMCETRINLDGKKYNNNTGKFPIIGQLFSPGDYEFSDTYTKNNDFFKNQYLSNLIDYSLIFSSLILWSLPKHTGDLIDNWGNLIASNIIDLEGNKGKIIKLCRFNYDLYAFQKFGFCKVLYNSQTMLSNKLNIPVYLFSSDSPNGVVYINTELGILNKNNIVITYNGIYFYDSNIKDFIKFDGEKITNLSSDRQNKYWFLNSNSSKIHLYYSNINHCIYIDNKEETLIFDYYLQLFIGTYSYNDVLDCFNMDDKIYLIKDNSIWQLGNSDTYCNFFNSQYSYSLSIIANPEFLIDKVFDTLEFRTDGTEEFINNKSTKYPFNTLTTTNEYQTATSDTSKLKKKFRTWRWQIGRDLANNRDRIRNNWAKITLEGDSTDKVLLYDLTVDYYV